MIFRDHMGKLIEINRLDFNNDKLYYNKIIQIKKPEFHNNMFLKNNILTNENYSNYIINKNLI